MTGALLAFLLLLAPVQLEEGATFYPDGSCIEADGTIGLAAADGSCVTPADYDVMFSYEALSQQPSLAVAGKSVAEVAGLAPDVRPSERQLGDGVLNETVSFLEIVTRFAGRNYPA